MKAILQVETVLTITFVAFLVFFSGSETLTASMTVGGG